MTKEDKPIKKERGTPGPRGRYDPDLHPRKLREIMAKGATQAEAAKALNITVMTLNRWLKKYPELFKADRDGRNEVDDKVEAALYKKAIGYTKNGKYYPGDTTAMIFWLKNRRPADWRDRKEIKFEGEIKTLADIKKLPDDKLLEYLMSPDEYSLEPLAGAENLEGGDDEE